MNVNIVNDNPMYLTDNTPAAEAHYRMRFYFDPNSIAMAAGDSHNIFYTYSGSPATALIRIPFYFSASKNQYMLNMQVRNDAGTWALTSSVALSDALHMFELEWQAASAPGANDGRFVFWLDGTLVSTFTGLDNDTHRIEQICPGPSAGVNTGTRGAYYLDAFESHRSSYIGPIMP